MSKDYYKILEVNKNASKDEIKKAFRKLAHKHHPDKSNGDEKKFKEINEAYQTLSNDNKRAQYDQFGSAFPGGGFPGGQSSGGGWGEGGINMEDILRNFGGGFSDFGDIFSGQSGRSQARQRRAKASDISIDLELSLEDIYKGINKEIELKKTIKCRDCEGSGGKPGSPMKKCSGCNGQGEIHQTQRTILGSFSRVSVCPECQGEGEKPEQVCSQCRGRGATRGVEKILVNVPFGVDDNQIIKLENHGEAGGKGNLSGDLYIKVHLRKHKHFIKRGDDIYYQLPISFTQAALGDKIEIPTLNGPVKLKVPAGIQSEKLLRLRGKGIARASGGRGDQLVKIHIEVPKKLSRKAKDLLKKLKEEIL